MAAKAAPPRADRIWTGGTIITLNDKAMRAQAIAEAGGKIIAVGTRAQVMKLRGQNTQVIDLQGRTMLPGFVDAHGHMMMGGLQSLSANLLAPPDGEVQDIAGLQRTFRDWIAANQKIVTSVNLVIGFGYDDAQLKEQRHPTRDDLDAVSKDVPILAVHQSGHLCALNSKALEAVAYTSATKDPAGGVIRRRDNSQEPNGVLEETAFFNAAYKLLPSIGPQGMKVFAREGAKLWARFGYTTAQEGRATPATLTLLREVANEGGYQIDLAVYPDVLIDREAIRTNVSKTYTKRMRVAGAKLTIDGSPQGFTAWRDRPYYKPVGNYPKGYSGYAAASADEVMGAISWATENNIQIVTHSNGERASDLLIASHTASQARFGKGKALRPVLIHGQFLREDQLDRFKALGVIPSLFPMHTFYWGDWHLNQTVGPKAGMNISPTGWARKRGMIFTSHHDAPVAFPNSMRVLDATVTRRARGSGRIVGPQHRVDVITALKAMTIWPAYTLFEESSKGTLEVGKLADFVILTKDPTAVVPSTIADIQVAETIKEGMSVFKLQQTAANSANEAVTETFSRMLHRMAHPQAAPASATASPEFARFMAQAASAAPPKDGVSCQSDVMMWLADAMARGGS
ncbi:amidohydrolase [beta proteobacterium AAP99]|nr:amidohydrolase [beta proteobacterium AAP99]